MGDLDPHHLVVPALALAVDALVQPKDAKDVLLVLAGEILADAFLELDQLLVDDGVEGPGRQRAHVDGHVVLPRGVGHRKPSAAVGFRLAGPGSKYHRPGREYFPIRRS